MGTHTKEITVHQLNPSAFPKTENTIQLNIKEMKKCRNIQIQIGLDTSSIHQTETIININFWIVNQGLIIHWTTLTCKVLKHRVGVNESHNINLIENKTKQNNVKNKR